jgi:hypothetical protein
MSIKQQIYFSILCIAWMSFSCIDRETSVGTGKLQPDRVLAISGNNQSGTVGNEAFSELIVRVLDASNQPVAKVRVEYSVQYGDASLRDTVAVTDFDGNAKTKVTYGKKADSLTIYATVFGLKGSPVIFTLRSFPANVGLLTAITDTVIVGQVSSARQESVRATDIFNNPVKNAVIKFEVKSGKGSVANSNVVTDSSGIASTLWTLDTLVGTNMLEVSIVGKIMAPIVFTALVLPGNASNLVVLSGGNQFGFTDAELPLPLQVAAQDRYGNYLTSPDVQFSNLRNPSGPTFKSRFFNKDSIPARTVVTVVLSPIAGVNRVSASMPPAPSVELRFNGYAMVFLAVPTSVAGAVTLNWDININPNFSSYKIYRSTNGTISTSSDLIATITDETVTTYLDPSTVPGTQYFFGVYVSFTNGEAFFTNGVAITP